MINQGKRYGSKSLIQVQDFTRREIDKVYQKNIPYLTLLFQRPLFFILVFLNGRHGMNGFFSWCIRKTGLLLPVIHRRSMTSSRGISN